MLSILTANIPLRAADGPKAKAVTKEIKRLEGTWIVVSEEVNGRKLNEAEINAQSNEPMVIKGNTLREFKGDGATLNSEFKIDPTAKPKTLDLAVISATGDLKKYEGKRSRAIYKLDGDRLKVCWTLFAVERERPKEFATKPDSGLLLSVYKRSKK